MDQQDLCQSLNALAEETWDHLRWGHETGFGQPDERAFTDHHLIELIRHHPEQVTASKFDQNREAETAADAEWWLGSGQRYLGMRVQAKKLDLASGTYVELGHHVGETAMRQLDQLIESSAKDGCLALYLFYNGPTETDWPADSCDNERLTAQRRGCTVALASDVKAVLSLGAEAIGPAELDQVSLPWQCLTCCPVAIGRDPAERTLEVLGRQRSLDLTEMIQPTELPSYARAGPIGSGDAGVQEPAALPGAPRVMVMHLEPIRA